MTTRQNLIWGGLVILLFLGALGWAGKQDPFSRQWFMLETPDHQSFRCVAVLPKPMRRYPVIVYAHESGGSLARDGYGLRQMAELGVATVSLEYDQKNGAAFDMQFTELLHYLDQQNWVNTNAIAWVGFSRGANSIFDFVLQRSKRQPRLLVQLSGAGIQAEQDEAQINKLKLLHCSFLLVHGEQDEIFPVADTEQLASNLRADGVPTEVKVIPDLPHDLEPEHGAVFRAVGEYCLAHLAGREAWQNYYSIARWQAEAPPLWLWWLPAAMWAGGWLIWSIVRSCLKIRPVKTQFRLRWLVVLLVIGSLAMRTVHLITPLFTVSDTTSAIARRFLLQPKERADFEYLIAQPIWRGQTLKTLLEHAELTAYNREQVNWEVDDKMYQNFVLSPVIDGSSSKELNWRRTLWENFYPRVSHENDVISADQIVIRFLRERMTIVPNRTRIEYAGIRTSWNRGFTDAAGFEGLYVAVLRSVGIPARLNASDKAEIWCENKWVAARRLLVPSFLPSE